MSGFLSRQDTTFWLGVQIFLVIVTTLIVCPSGLIECEKIQAFFGLNKKLDYWEMEEGFNLNREHIIFGIYTKRLNSRFLAKNKFLIIKEKYFSKLRDKFEAFTEKWQQITPIYDSRGPDNLNIFFPCLVS